MRVLETEVVSTYSMGRKSKHKLRKSKDNDASDSSEDVTGKGCTHISKAVTFNTMKKGLSKQVFGECGGCAKEASSKKGDKQTEETGGSASGLDCLEEEEPTLWVCLQCGHQGCDRNSTDKHALKHHETPHSSSHCVVINTSTWTTWCYECDDELNPERFKRLAECMDHVKKLACVPTVDCVQGRSGSGSGGPTSTADIGSNKGRPQTPKGATAANSVCQKVKGLSNLGNTCFFNAVMQNLIQTYSLENLLGERKKGKGFTLICNDYCDMESGASSDDGEEDKDMKPFPTIEINLSDPGPLTHSLVVFLHETNTNSRSGIINPSALFGQVCKKAPRFKGFQQQDSHELLRYLLDNMRTEEVKRGQTGILKHFKMSENLNLKKVDDDTKKKVKVYGRRVKHTFVECLFGGQLISTVVCEECKHISQVLEPFLDLSLPVTEEKPQRPNQGLAAARKKEIRETQGEPVEEIVNGEGWYCKDKDEKQSKHQTKKQRRQAKKDAKKTGSKATKTASESGQKDMDEDKDESKEEDLDGKTENGEERCDASDADVEDNLESDTSRCYGQAANGSLVPDDSIEQSAFSETKDVSSAHQSTITNDSPNNNHISQTSGLATSACNGPIKHEETQESLSVSYTMNQNGIVSEDAENGNNGVVNSLAGSSSDLEVCTTVQNDNSTSIVEQTSVSQHGVQGVPQLDSQCLGRTDTQKQSTQVTQNHVSQAAEVKSLANEKADKEGRSVSACTTPILNGETEDVTADIVLSESVSNLTLNGDVVSGADQPSQQLDRNKPAPVTVGTATIPECSTSSVNEEDGCKKLFNHLNQSTEGTAVSHKVQYNDKHLSNSPAEKCSQSWKELKKEGKRKSVSPLVERYHPSSGECSIESCLHQFTSAELLTGNNKFGCKNCTKVKQKLKERTDNEKKEVVYTNANKQFLIFEPPAVLTLHLKRFEQIGYSSRKVNRHVEFPFILDLAPYCSSLCQDIKRGQKKILYALYGVVEHSGRLSSGHYTAYVKVRPNMGTLTNFLNINHVTIREYLYKYAEQHCNGATGSLGAEVAEDVNAETMIPPGRWYHISDSRVNEVTEASVERAQAYLLFYERVY